MGNESSKRASRSNTASGNNRKSNKNVSINQADIERKNKKQLKMDDSAHTFGPTGSASISGHRRGGSPVMITDALSDVRTNYHIDSKELGHGHYGVVRKCMHRESGKWYAIKSIRKAKVSKIEVLKREIEILKEVKHPNIIELVEVFEDEKYLHLITEICTGGELFDRIIAKTQSDEGHFSEKDAAALVRDILDAIRYCHDEKGIVHRDLKPENFLFLTEADDAPVKIIDFGLSRHDDAEYGIMQTKVGTPYYVAPEVLRREYTNSCDIWSIGVITYILLCGYPPFYGDSDTQIFESVRVGKFDFPSPEWDNISESAKDFVIQMLKKNPAQRPTAAEALKHRWLKEQLGTTKIDRRGSVSHRSNRTNLFTKYLAMKKLKKAALGYIASKLTKDELSILEKEFRARDADNDGCITLNELDEAIASGDFKQELVNELRTLRQELAVSGEEKINWKDFLSLTMDRGYAMREEYLRMAFNHFKHSDADHLTVEDLAEIFGGMGPATDVINYLDDDGDGKVTYSDFKAAMVEKFDGHEEDEEDGDDSITSHEGL